MSAGRIGVVRLAGRVPTKLDWYVLWKSFVASPTVQPTESFGRISCRGGT